MDKWEETGKLLGNEYLKCMCQLNMFQIPYYKENNGVLKIL